MNFLAHLYFGETPEVKVGNLAGDFLRDQKNLLLYQPSIRRGIILHRNIDKFTNSHQLFLDSTRLVVSVPAFYAPIVVDVFFDHFLARNWESYHDQPLNLFAQEVYGWLREYKELLPENLRRATPEMIEQDWLSSYCYRKGILAALNRLMNIISRRYGRDSNLVAAMKDFDNYYDCFSRNFDQFFPELIDESKTWVSPVTR